MILYTFQKGLAASPPHPPRNSSFCSGGKKKKTVHWQFWGLWQNTKYPFVRSFLFYRRVWMGGLVGTLFLFVCSEPNQIVVVAWPPGRRRKTSSWLWLSYVDTRDSRLELRENPNLQKPNKFYKHPKVQKSLPSQPEKRVKQQQKKIWTNFWISEGAKVRGRVGKARVVRPPGIVNQARRQQLLTSKKARSDSSHPCDVES